MNAFDLVVTVALGSTLATMLLSKSVALVEAVSAMALLVLLQFTITWMSVRSPGFRDLVKSEPTLLLRRGQFLDGAMRAQRITRDEVMAALRLNGVLDVADAAGRQSYPDLASIAAHERRSIEVACEQLRPFANVEVLSFENAYTRALELLAICTLTGIS